VLHNLIKSEILASEDNINFGPNRSFIFSACERDLEQLFSRANNDDKTTAIASSTFH
jgi:hypothetical protein